MDHNDPIIRHPYQVYQGVAAEDIEEKSVTLLVICPEIMPNSIYGDIGASISNQNISLKDRRGNTLSSSVTSANHIVATWEGHSNLRYPPIIRKGEPVEIYRAEGQDKYIWRTTGRGRDFRQTDRVHVEVSAMNPTATQEEKNDTNTYSAYLDSGNKVIGIKTSKKNGEVTAWSMEMDMQKGTFHLSDDSDEPGNRIFLDTGKSSGVPSFQINLATGATFKLENNDLFIKLDGNMFVDVGKRLVINSPLTVFNVKQKGAIIFNAAELAFNAAKDFVLNASNAIGINAASTKIGGVLVAGSARISSAVKGTFGSVYKGVSVSDPTSSMPISGSNTADTNIVGPPYQG